MTDYKTLHLSWIKNHSQFVPSGGYLFDEVPYLDIMSDMYHYQRACTQLHAQKFFASDMKCYFENQKAINQLTKEAVKSDPLAPIFVTIGFNHQTWDIPSCVKVIKNICSFDWIQSIRAVFELHRDNGLHPHVHMLITLSQPITKSKVLEKLWAAAGMKKVCLKKTFIDYKVAADYHHKYILGQKQESKMQYVLQDQKWRQENGIDEYFTK